MSKYFNNVQSFDDLKSQFKALARKNHPDAGGDAETMKEINIEFDALFTVWKDRKEASTGSAVNETANDTRREFYTRNGWEGSRHDWNRTLKEVAQIVRAYVKEKYPTYKFSVRTHYASMCQELTVELKESPIDIYKPFEELTEDDLHEIAKRVYLYDVAVKLDFLNSSKEEKKKSIEASGSRWAYMLNDVTQTIIKDVDAFVNSYNYHDCDGQIDYFDVDFYYFGCCQDNGEKIKIVPKTARIKNKSTKPTAKKAHKESAPEPGRIEKKNGYTYRITQGEDTRDGSALWIVRINETLERAEYIAENNAMKARGGYYSKFKHGFIFRFDPSEVLKIN